MKSPLENLKYEVAAELGIGTDDASYKEKLEKMKIEAAKEIGIYEQIKDGYWGEVPSRECGRVGGRLGGKIGGNMVKKLITLAEQQLQK
nr:alpha/beta-type small acid-soluble spore protein [Carboxydothermus pertinax]